MDKYEFNIKVEQIKKLMKKKDYITAVKIADTIDWDKVKDNQLLIMVADVYEIAGRYDAARDALLTAYERTGLGRQLAYRLCRLSVKRGDITEAQEFYEEFTENSPRDAGRYILQYEMAKGSGQPLSKQIEILETYIEADMDDKWAFELAKLYHKAQMSEKCIELCDTIILWFADGKYVEKALELKQLYVPLSEHQRLKYETQKSRKADIVSGSTTKIIEEAVQKVIEQEAEPPVSEITAGDASMYVIPPADEAKKPELELYRDEVPEVQPETMAVSSDDNVVENNSSTQDASEEIPDGEILDKVREMDFDVNNVHFKDYSVNNKYDTVNIQKELAQSVSSLFDNTGELFRPIPRQGFEPVEEKADDQITGQMNLDEVLAMFEAGEFGKKEEATPAENVAEAETVVESANEIIDQPILEDDVEDVEVDVPEVVEAEEIVTDTEIEEISMEIIEAVESTVEEEPVEEELVADEAVEESDGFNIVEEDVALTDDDDIEELEDIEDEILEDEQVEQEEFLTDDADEDDEFQVEEPDAEETVEPEMNEVVQSEAIEETQEFDIDEDGVVDEEEIVADIIANEIIFDVTEEIDEVIEDIVEETIEVASEEPELKETVEEDSEVAESEIQEREPIMYDLKDDFEEETTEYTEDDIVEDVVDETATETVASTEEDIEVQEDSEDDDIKEEPVAEEAKPVQTKAKKPVIQSETAKEELKKFIARFSGVQGLDKQILKVMQNTLKGDDSPVKFIFVKGEVKSGKTTLAIDVLKLANKMMKRRDQRIAKIKAESINGKSIDALLVKLGGSDVLIEKVSDMQPDTFVEFIDKLKAEGTDRFVIFEDEKSLAENFLAKVPEAYRDFANILDIKQNKIKDWTKMASNYAESKGYAFDEMGILALSAKIDQLRAITLVVHKNHIEQLVDGAIKRANKFSFAKLFGKPKNDDGLILLTEKDFID